MHHDRPDALPMGIGFAWYLLRLRQNRLDLAQIDGDDALLAAGLVSLDHPGDEITVTVGIFPEVDLIGRLTQPLKDDLLRGHRRDPAEVVRGVVKLPDERAAFG